MEIDGTIAEMRALTKRNLGSLGFVHTMGYLHEGHLALVKRARAENSIVAVSIFLNCTRFGPTEDFKTYPRDLDRDLNLLEKEKTNIVFLRCDSCCLADFVLHDPPQDVKTQNP